MNPYYSCGTASSTARAAHTHVPHSLSSEGNKTHLKTQLFYPKPTQLSCRTAKREQIPLAMHILRVLWELRAFPYLWKHNRNPAGQGRNLLQQQVMERSGVGVRSGGFQHRWDNNEAGSGGFWWIPAQVGQ